MTAKPDIPQSAARRTKRIYSDAFVQRQIDRIDDMNEACRLHTPLLPDLDEWKHAKVRAVMQHRSRMSYCEGFWAGWTLRDHAPEPESEVTG